MNEKIDSERTAESRSMDCMVRFDDFEGLLLAVMLPKMSHDSKWSITHWHRTADGDWYVVAENAHGYSENYVVSPEDIFLFLANASSHLSRPTINPTNEND